jgi:hypothetical protein
MYLNFDFNTLNYTQWYYFSVRNIKKGKSTYPSDPGAFRLHLQV